MSSPARSPLAGMRRLVPVLLALLPIAGAQAQDAPGAPTAEDVGEALPPGKPALQKAWIRCDRWPDARTPETFGKDVLRLEADRLGCDEDKVVMLYHWITRCFGRSGGSREGPKGQEGVVVDEWKDFHCYGQGLCDRWGRLSATIVRGAGFPARKIGPSSHTMFEAYYRDRDGRSAWHLFDPHMGWYVYSPDRSHIMSARELAENTEAFFAYSQASQPYFVRDSMPRPSLLPDAEKIRAQKRWFKSCVVSRVWPVTHDMRMDLPTGAEFTRYWERNPGIFYYHDGLKPNKNHCPAGYHDPTSPFYDDGTVKDPENYPFWKPYLIDCEACETKNVKPAGYGVLRWKVPLCGQDFGREAWLCSNAVAGARPAGPRVHPRRAGEQATLIYAVNLPYVIADAKVRGRVWRRDRHASTELTFALSLDGGETWHGLSKVDNVNRQAPWDLEIDLGKKRWEDGKASAYGTYGFLLRIDMLGFRDAADVGLEDLEIESQVQLNMWTLPFLRPGVNHVEIEGSELQTGKAVEVTYRWDDASGKDRSETRRMEKLPARFCLEVAGAKPDDVRMRSIALAVPGPEQPRREFKSEPALDLRPQDRRVPAPLVATPPVLDGALDDHAWRESGEIDGLVDAHALQVEQGADKTRVFLCRNGTHLYLAFDCQEAVADKWNTVIEQRDGQVWKDNSVEVFICPTGKEKEFWQIVSNSLGTVMDAYHAQPGKPDCSRNLNVAAKGKRRDGRWTVEMAIPLDELGVDPAKGSVRFDLNRTVWGDSYGGGQAPLSEQVFCSAGGTRAPERFGYLEFEK